MAISRIICPELNSMHSLSWSPDGERIVVGRSRTIEVWNMVSGQKLLEITRSNDGIPTVAWGPDGKFIAWSSQRCADVFLLDSATGETVRVLGSTHKWVHDLKWSPDGKTIASVYHEEKDERRSSVTLWEAVTGREVGGIKDYQGVMVTTAWSPDGKKLAVGSREKTLMIWDVADLASPRDSIVLNRQVRHMTWHVDGKTIVASDGHFNIYDTEKRELKENPWEDWDFLMTTELSPDGKALLSLCYGTVMKIRDVKTGEALFSDWVGGKWEATDAKWSPDGSKIAVCSWNGVMSLMYNSLQTALVSTMTGSSPAATHFANQWMYDPRVWTRVAQFF